MKEDYIVAYRIKGKMICEKCITIDEIIGLLGKEEDIIMSSDNDKTIYSCERCKKRIERNDVS